MKIHWTTKALFVVVAVSAYRSYRNTQAAQLNTQPVLASSGVSLERGKQLVRIGGCNDCHTPGFAQKGELIPETEWLTGVPVGWRGPWGTTYASNLRQQLAAFPDAEMWVAMIRQRKGLPPMPWASLHAMTDDDLRSLHSYIRSLPVTGSTMPATRPPSTEPTTPYINLEPVMPAPASDEN